MMNVMTHPGKKIQMMMNRRSTTDHRELVEQHPEEWSHWEATEYGLRCKGCSHVLPWLHDPGASLCGRCSHKARDKSRVSSGSVAYPAVLRRH